MPWSCWATQKTFWPRPVSAVAAGDRAGCARWAGCFCADADRRREIALFSVAGFDARRANNRGVAAHRADERSSGRAANQRNCSDVPEFNAESGGGKGALARPASRRVSNALRRAGAADVGHVFGARAQLEHCAIRHRRSALHQRMGPRFPAGISRAEEAAETFTRCAAHGAHRHGHGTRARRHRQRTEIAGPTLLRGQFQPAESDIPGRSQNGALRTTAGLHSQPA